MSKAKRPQAAMIEAADAVEEFTHLSQVVGPDWKTPPHTYAALGPLVRLARNLDQAVEQVTFPVERSNGEGRVTIDDDSGPVGKLAALGTAQERAQRAARALEAALNDMWSAAGHLGYDTRGLPEYDHDLEGHTHV